MSKMKPWICQNCGKTFKQFEDAKLNERQFCTMRCELEFRKAMSEYENSRYR